uniref:Uncharacterized protein n=1 Tax=Terrapene triunguis TaxID=2587831 RepID=A0A674IVS7_9SAUR
MGAMRPALALLSLAYLMRTAATLRICAFNIRTFGDSKLSNETIAGIIVNVSAGGLGRGPTYQQFWGCPGLHQIAGPGALRSVFSVGLESMLSLGPKAT